MKHSSTIFVLKTKPVLGVKSNYWSENETSLVLKITFNQVSFRKFVLFVIHYGKRVNNFMYEQHNLTIY